MSLMDLHVYVKSANGQTQFTIHNFEPTVRVSDETQHPGPEYNYITLTHGKYADPVTTTMFMNCADVIAMYDKLTPVVARFRELMAAKHSAPAPALVAQETTECPTDCPTSPASV